MPEVASRRHLELVAPVIREALVRGRRDARRRRARGGDAGPGLIGALLVGLAAAKAIAWSRRLPLVPVDHLDGHVASLYLQPDPVEPPFLCLLASGGHTLLLDVRGHREQRAARDDARRRGRRGVRQGRAPARARLSGRPRDRPARARRRPGGVRLPGRARPRPRLLVLRAEDGAPLRRPRPRARRAGGAPRRPRGVVPARDRAGARRARPRRRRSRPGASGSPSSAGSPRTPSCASRCRAPRSRRSRSAPTTRR